MLGMTEALKHMERWNIRRTMVGKSERNSMAKEQRARKQGTLSQWQMFWARSTGCGLSSFHDFEQHQRLEPSWKIDPTQHYINDFKPSNGCSLKSPIFMPNSNDHDFILRSAGSQLNLILSKALIKTMGIHLLG
jgi:hypothetical protein